MRRASLLVVLALILTAPFFLTDAFVQAGPGKPAPPPTFSDSGPEPQLSRILVEIENNQLDKALQLTENLLQQYPKFRLAHLIKGDLLLARSMPLATFGNATNAPSDKLDDLREEVIARLKAYRSRDTTAKYVPRYLLQMQPDQKHAIVIDTQKARLYLYQNDNGRPRFVADYYVSHGKLGSDKRSEGDKKTPTGVYHVTDSLPAKKLGDLYGIVTGQLTHTLASEAEEALAEAQRHGLDDTH